MVVRGPLVWGPTRPFWGPCGPPKSLRPPVENHTDAYVSYEPISSAKSVDFEKYFRTSPPPKKIAEIFSCPPSQLYPARFRAPQPEKIVPPPCPDKEWTTPELLKATIKEVLPRFHTRE